MESIPTGELLQALSASFEYPANGIAATLEPLRSVRAGAVPTEGAGAAPARGSAADEAVAGEIARTVDLSAGFGALVDEQLAYTRLFIGSFKMEAPPYASYYLDPGRLVNGPTTAQVSAVYRQFGIELGPECKAPADHIRYLLAFLSVLASRFHETGEPVFAQAYVDFRDLYVLSWIDPFQQLVDSHADNPYYPQLVRLVHAVLRPSR